MNDLILYQEDVEKLDAILQEFVSKASLICALLTSKEGQLMACQGETDDIDTVSVAALITGSFSATVTIANLIGEAEFKTMLHHGAHKHIQIELVDKDRYLAALFDNRTSTAIVSEHAETACEELCNYLAFISGNENTASLPTLDFGSPDTETDPQVSLTLPDEPSDLVDSFESFRNSIASSESWTNAEALESEEMADSLADQIITPEMPVEDVFHLEPDEEKTVAEDIVDTVAEDIMAPSHRQELPSLEQQMLAQPSKTAYLRIKIEEAKAYQKHKPRNDIIARLVGKRKQRSY